MAGNQLVIASLLNTEKGSNYELDHMTGGIVLELIGSAIVLYIATVYISQDHKLEPHRFIIWVLFTMIILVGSATAVEKIFDTTDDIVFMLYRGAIILFFPAAFLFFVLKSQFYVQSVKERMIILSIFVASYIILSFA